MWISWDQQTIIVYYKLGQDSLKKIQIQQHNFTLPAFESKNHPLWWHDKITETFLKMSWYSTKYDTIVLKADKREVSNNFFVLFLFNFRMALNCDWWKDYRDFSVDESIFNQRRWALSDPREGVRITPESKILRW